MDVSCVRMCAVWTSSEEKFIFDCVYCVITLRRHLSHRRHITVTLCAHHIDGRWNRKLYILCVRVCVCRSYRASIRFVPADLCIEMFSLTEKFVPHAHSRAKPNKYSKYWQSMVVNVYVLSFCRAIGIVVDARGPPIHCKRIDANGRSPWDIEWRWSQNHVHDVKSDDNRFLIKLNILVRLVCVAVVCVRTLCARWISTLCRNRIKTLTLRKSGILLFVYFRVAKNFLNYNWQRSKYTITKAEAKQYGHRVESAHAVGHWKLAPFIGRVTPNISIFNFHQHFYVYPCVCVGERDRERESRAGSGSRHRSCHFHVSELRHIHAKHVPLDDFARKLNQQLAHTHIPLVWAEKTKIKYGHSIAKAIHETGRDENMACTETKIGLPPRNWENL